MDKVKFDNLALKVLPVDSVEENYVRTVSGACFSRVNSLNGTYDRYIRSCFYLGQTNTSEKSKISCLVERCSSIIGHF